jgi:hypothetical protein
MVHLSRKIPRIRTHVSETESKKGSCRTDRCRCSVPVSGAVYRLSCDRVPRSGLDVRARSRFHLRIPAGRVTTGLRGGDHASRFLYEAAERGNDDDPRCAPTGVAVGLPVYPVSDEEDNSIISQYARSRRWMHSSSGGKGIFSIETTCAIVIGSVQFLPRTPFVCLFPSNRDAPDDSVEEMKWMMGRIRRR